MENIDTLKRSDAGMVKYRLSNAVVLVSPGGYHFIDYLDPVEKESSETSPAEPTPEDVAYIEKSLQSNSDRFENQVRIVSSRVTVENAKILDIGCGGGLFLSRMRDVGAIVLGIEPNGTRAHYARTKHDLEIVEHPIDADSWRERYSNKLDVVTIWDVIEHVNYPLSTLQSATHVLKRGGLVFIDTPCRDSFYHRCGAFTYWISRGRFPTFLNAMYSSHKFGHKQIFSTSEMTGLLDQAGYEVVEVRKFHELSFPYIFYLKRLLGSDFLARLLLPVVYGLLAVFPVKNKMLVIGRKK